MLACWQSIGNIVTYRNISSVQRSSFISSCVENRVVCVIVPSNGVEGHGGSIGDQFPQRLNVVPALKVDECENLETWFLSIF